MQANNITVSIPNKGCAKDCPYCISKMTGYIKTHEELFYHNLPMARRTAKRCGATHMLITSKGEPLQNIPAIKRTCEIFEKYPIEIQTNGLLLDASMGFELQHAGVNIVAVSVDHPHYFDLNCNPQMWQAIKNFNMIARATVMVFDIFEEWSLRDFINVCHANGIRQLTFRSPTVPERTVPTTESKKAVQYIFDHNAPKLYKSLQQDLIDTVHAGKGNIIMQLPFGPIVYDIEGVAITSMDYCMQEQSNGLNIRSLIYMEDGHLYTCWDKKGSILW